MTSHANSALMHCTHGVVFDEVAAEALLADCTPSLDDVDGVAFIMGNPKAAEVRKRWPRGWFTAEHPCPFCGFVGIAYASMAHYQMGDW